MHNEINNGYALGKAFPTTNAAHKKSCRSSVVEHPLGKREADGSIPSGSTIYAPRVVAAFWSKVEVRPNTPIWRGACWPWRASIDKWGYGQFKPVARHNPLRAHRVAWEIWNGRDVPDGLDILHECDNPKCCNPAHLRPGTHADNMADKVARGRSGRGAPRKGKRT